MLAISRRKLIVGGAAFIAAPAIVRVENIMAVSSRALKLIEMPLGVPDAIEAIGHFQIERPREWFDAERHWPIVSSLIRTHLLVRWDTPNGPVRKTINGEALDFMSRDEYVRLIQNSPCLQGSA